jgi:N6-L-threonylcarbamoyladenine synthase
MLRRQANIKEQLSAIAFTQGPGLMDRFCGQFFCKINGFSLSYPSCFSAYAAHILAHFINEEGFENLVFLFLVL